MNKDINQMQEVRAQSALEKVRELLQPEVKHSYGGLRLYRLAVARRYTVCYFAFLNYLMGRLAAVEEYADDLGMEDIIHRARQQNLFGVGDERMIIQMSMIYAALSYYSEGFEGKNDDLLKDIPRMCDFMERFIGIFPTAPQGLSVNDRIKDQYETYV